MPFNLQESFAIGLGIAVSFGSDNLGLSGVLGIGATIKTGNQTSLLYSISITNQENEKNHTGSKWSVENLHPITDANNVTIGYLGLVIERYKGEWGKDAVTNNTGIIVYSPAKSVLEDGQIKYNPTNTWKSPAYMTKERELNNESSNNSNGNANVISVNNKLN